VTSTLDNPYNALPANWASDAELLAGLTVDDDDEHDDPVLRYADGRTVETWREDYPYPERLTRAEYEYLKRPLQIELVKLQNWVKDTGQRIVLVFEGRDAAAHGYPILLSNLLAGLEGTAYVARGAVNSAVNVNRTRKMINQALRTQLAGRGFSFVEILTMCPTGWFVPTAEGPGYLDRVLRPVHATGELKHGDRCITSEQLLVEARARAE